MIWQGGIDDSSGEVGEDTTRGLCCVCLLSDYSKCSLFFSQDNNLIFEKLHSQKQQAATIN